MFGSFAHQGAGAEYYRSPRHRCNGSAGGDAFVPAPVGVPVAALSSTVFAGRAPIPRHGGHLVPGGSAVAGRPGAVAWGMIGVEVINSAAACLEAPPTARPPVPIHVINLKHRPERWGRCQALELDPRLRLERFNAVATLRGWVGCARSHLQLIRDARARGDLWVVVAEDDFVPTLPPKLWADHLLSVLDAIEQPDAQFDVFNSLPSGRWTGQLVTPAGPGLWRVNGGANTHLMVYSARMFEMAEQWEVDLRAVESRPGGRVNAECVMAWDRWIGATARVATKVPHITATTLDTSDIVPGGVITGQAAMHMAEVVGGLWDIKWLHAGREWPATVRLRFVAVPSALASCELYATVASVLNCCCGRPPTRVVGVTKADGRLTSKVFEQAWGNPRDGFDDCPYELTIEAGWALRKPAWLVAWQCAMVLSGNNAVFAVSLRDLPDVPRPGGRSPFSRGTPTPMGGIMVWPFRDDGPVLNPPCVQRVDGSGSKAALLPGGAAVRTTVHSPGKIVPQ